MISFQVFIYSTIKKQNEKNGKKKSIIEAKSILINMIKV